MAVQQCRVSRTRVRTRKSANRYRGLQTAVCTVCGAPRKPHRICGQCGNYKGRQVISVTAE